jgi:DNA ligase D-like protein (predicted ligase)/DNA ligase D-like protein (predicted 3'-phosphoesterase)
MNQPYKPMLAKEAPKPFSDKNWIFEIKWDGFRAIAYINEELSLRSRNNHELMDNFPELNELRQKAKNAVLDGEIIIINKGKLDFQALLERNKESNFLFKTNSSAVYVVFDILEKNGKSLIDLPLMERKRILKDTVAEGSHVILADYIEEKGEAYYNVAIEKGLEGIIAKKKTSPYEQGSRSGDWLKIKKLHTIDCVIFGYTQGTGIRKSTFGALLLGLYDNDGKVIYVGKVGTGFTQKILNELLAQFYPLKTNDSPLNLEISEEVSWVKPKFVCEISYQVVTKDGRLRMPRFQRMRTDKKPEECKTEQLGENSLKTYEAKRDFSTTTEPKGNRKDAFGEAKIFVVQEHHARHLHYDFRLEREGVLKSWAVPKGVPQDANDKRLAVETEDHPVDYAKFEGTIPEGQYGAGQVIIWDKGTYETKIWNEKMIEIILNGAKLHGRYVLVPFKRGGPKNWLMLKPKE